MPRAQTVHPLDPLSAAEISVAVATVRAAGATPEVHSSVFHLRMTHLLRYLLSDHTIAVFCLNY